MNEEINEPQEQQEDAEQLEVYSRSVRAGKRTYFFDVKTTSNNDFFLSITESKKRYHKSGKSYYEKHKIFLYKEDFEKFTECLCDVLKHISEAQTEYSDNLIPDYNSEVDVNFTDVNFSDLDSTGQRIN